MRLIAKNCPELGSFEVEPVTLTRNKLMEHAKGESGIFNANLVLGEEGPEVKGVRWEGQSEDWPDPGMFASADEFDTKLRALLGPYPVRNTKEKLGHPKQSPRHGAWGLRSAG
jgi:hypothetical protein